MKPPDNPYYAQAKSYLDNLDYTTPITQAYGKLRNEIHESGNEFFGGRTAPEVAGKVRSGRLFRAMTDYGESMSAAKQRENADRLSGTMALGAGTAPVLVNAGGTQEGAQWGSGFYSPLGQLGLGAIIGNALA